MNRKYKIISGIFIPVIVACLLICFYFPKNQTQVVIKLNNKEYGTYSLYYDQTIRVEDEKHYNIVQIKHGKVSVIEANCANQICVHTKSISTQNPGTIVCMPHQMIVELK